MESTEPRRSHKEWKLPKSEYKKRFFEKFYDPYFDKHREQLEELAETAWKAYEEGRKAPRTQKAGPGYADPNYDLSIEWAQAKARLDEAYKVHADKNGPDRILLISAAHRNDLTCPGEISKTSRLTEKAEKILKEQKAEVEILDLSELISEYGRKIYPCKACVSTSMPLCHWPCSCYPNHYLDQVHDWMNDIYPMWARCHGVMIITPVYWHQSPSALKLMIDRLVCADGGNPDPTSTQGKEVKLAKELELKGWDYPRHLKGRIYSVVVHGDTLGVDDAKNTLCSWLDEIELIPSSHFSRVQRYIGYFEPYATSHLALDRDEDMVKEVENAAKALVLSVKAARAGKLESMTPELKDPRPK